MCKTQKLTESWEVSVCDYHTAACCDGFNFAGCNQKGLWKRQHGGLLRGILKNALPGFLAPSLTAWLV